MKTKLNRILITKCARKTNPKAIESTAPPASTIPHPRFIRLRNIILTYTLSITY